ncbi:MAG: response regulator [Proteobacteria bacterium]|nr:response regulator [Pseudomonadota bacterium]
MNRLATAQRQDKAYDLSRFRLLIIEDSAFIGSLLTGALKTMGVGSIIMASSFAEARQVIARCNAFSSTDNIDVVMTDWLTPDGEGEDFIKWIRENRADSIKYLPVIVCSAFADRDLVEHSRDSGANEVLVKPVSAEKIAQRILYVIDKPRAYVQAPEFFGPERRRQDKRFDGTDKRVMRQEDIEVDHERAG